MHTLHTIALARMASRWLLVGCATGAASWAGVWVNSKVRRALTVRSWLPLLALRVSCTRSKEASGNLQVMWDVSECATTPYCCLMALTMMRVLALMLVFHASCLRGSHVSGALA